MEILRSIALYTEEKNMPFILIGGHAVNAYGISRQTGDIDLLVPQKDNQLWDDLLRRLKYGANQKDERFARYRSTDLATWPIDLMFVDQETFKKMLQDAEDTEVGVAEVKVVSKKHLLTLKIHALKNHQEHRFLKDMSDTIALVKLLDDELNDEELKSLCKQYANLDLYQKIKLMES